MVWDAAIGANVRNVDGNVFVNLSAGFGVALVGHAHPAVVAAARIRPAACPTRWATRSRTTAGSRSSSASRSSPPPGSRRAPGPVGLRCRRRRGEDRGARHRSGRGPRVRRRYHGLALGVLGLQGYKEAFSEPFRALHPPRGRRLPWAARSGEVRDALLDGRSGWCWWSRSSGAAGSAWRPTAGSPTWPTLRAPPGRWSRRRGADGLGRTASRSPARRRRGPGPAVRRQGARAAGSRCRRASGPPR